MIPQNGQRGQQRKILEGPCSNGGDDVARDGAVVRWCVGSAADRLQAFGPEEVQEGTKTLKVVTRQGGLSDKTGGDKATRERTRCLQERAYTMATRERPRWLQESVHDGYKRAYTMATGDSVHDGDTRAYTMATRERPRW